MDNVTEHKCFPTILNEFDYDMDTQEHDLVIDELNDMEKYKSELITQTTDNLALLLPKFTKHIYDVTESICKKQSYLYDRLEFTGMWANKLVKGEVHQPHTHSNNIFSGVYYLEGGSPIQFFDPRPQASVFQLNVTKSTSFNCSMLSFDSEKGGGLMFPSWLQHWVPPTNKTRISISWNIILRGDYGQPDTLQNSHI